MIRTLRSPRNDDSATSWLFWSLRVKSGASVPTSGAMRSSSSSATRMSLIGPSGRSPGRRRRDAQREDRRVVVQPVAEPAQEAAQRRDHLDGGGGGQDGQELLQVLLVVAGTAADAGLGEPVGV